MHGREHRSVFDILEPELHLISLSSHCLFKCDQTPLTVVHCVVCKAGDISVHFLRLRGIPLQQLLLA